MSNEPVGLFLTADRKIFPYKIKTRGTRYFVKKNNNATGIYTVNSKYSWKMGKTPIYFFYVGETNTIDPVMIHLLNTWKKKNGLTEIKRKDVNHGRKLRTLIKQMGKKEAIVNLKTAEGTKSGEIKQIVSDVQQEIEQRVETIRTQHNKEINPTNTEKGLMLLAHLKEIGKIDDTEYQLYWDKVEKNTYTFDMLLDEMREKYDVQVSEPLDLDVEDFIQDLGAVSAPELAGFCQDQIKSKRGLRDLTPAPVKAFMSAGILLALLIGGAIILAVGAPYLVGNAHLPTGGEGAIKMPWDFLTSKFILGLKFW